MAVAEKTKNVRFDDGGVISGIDRKQMRMLRIATRKTIRWGSKS
jgi:hypothetical protein